MESAFNFPSPGRPGQRTPTKNVNVEVRDGFPAVTAVVDDQPVTVFLEAGLRGDFSSLQQKMSQE